jgi:hypothetical protein
MPLSFVDPRVALAADRSQLPKKFIPDILIAKMVDLFRRLYPTTLTKPVCVPDDEVAFRAPFGTL